MEHESHDEPTIRALQGRAFLRGLDGKLLDPRITDVLYDNAFALAEMAAGRLVMYKMVVGHTVWDLVEYNELADPFDEQMQEVGKSILATPWL